MVTPVVDVVDVQHGTAGGVTHSVTINARDNQIAVAIFQMAPASGFSSAPILGTLPMNQVPGFPVDSASGRVDAWYVIDPDTGVQNLKFTIGLVVDVVYTLVTAYGVDPVVGILPAVPGSGTGVLAAMMDSGQDVPVLVLGILAVSQLVPVVVTTDTPANELWNITQGADPTGVIGVGTSGLRAPSWTFTAATDWAGACLCLLPVFTAADAVALNALVNQQNVAVNAALADILYRLRN